MDMSDIQPIIHFEMWWKCSDGKKVVAEWSCNMPPPFLGMVIDVGTDSFLPQLIVREVLYDISTGRYAVTITSPETEETGDGVIFTKEDPDCGCTSSEIVEMLGKAEVGRDIQVI